MTREWSHSLLTTASSQQIWHRWTTPECWVEDDPSLRAASFGTPPAVGTTGTVTGFGGRTPFMFTDVVEGTRMTFEISLPGATLSLPHQVEQTEQGALLTHGFELSGPLSWMWSWTILRRLRRELPTVVRLVADHAIST